MWSLLLLAATVGTFAHLLLRLSNRNKTYPTYDVTHKKSEIQNFPFFSMQSRKLATSFEGLTSS